MKIAPAIALLIAGAALAGRMLCLLDSSPPATPDHLIQSVAPIGEWLNAALAWIKTALSQLASGP